MSVLEDLEVVLWGCAIVLGVLALLWGLTALIGAIVALAGRRPAVAAVSMPTAAVGVPPHHLVAIAAAVEAAVGGGHRLVSISAPAHRVSAWASSAHRPGPHRPRGPGPRLNQRTDRS